MDQLSGLSENPKVYGFVDLMRDVWSHKWTTMATMIVVALLGVFYGLLAPREYTANVTIAPVLSKQNSQGLSGIGGSVTTGLSGLASLAGIPLPGKEEDQEAIAVLG